jgi:hypothetical protein
MPYPYRAKERVEALIEALETLIKRDPDQEVGGMAVPVLDAVVEATKEDLPEEERDDKSEARGHTEGSLPAHEIGPTRRILLSTAGQLRRGRGCS